MRSSILFLIALLGIAGCGKQQSADDQAGSATQSAFSEVIDGKQGYIVENASFASASDQVLYSIGDKFRLSQGESCVMIITLDGTDQTAGSILAVQFPSFAAGTTVDYRGDTTNAQFWLSGNSPDGSVMFSTGLVSGAVRLIKKSKSSLNLGLDRDLLDGIGDIEMVVSNIKPGGLKFPAEKKYAARFNLPILTISELSKITRPT